MDDQSLARSPRTDSPRVQGGCRSCYGTGYVFEDVAYDPETGEYTETTIVCLVCRGEGEISMFLYATPRPR